MSSPATPPPPEPGFYAATWGDGRPGPLLRWDGEDAHGFESAEGETERLVEELSAGTLQLERVELPEGW